MREMKNSGIEWIGEIPAEWKLCRVKNISSVLRGGSPRPIENYLTDEPTGLNWIKIGDTEKNKKYITKTSQKIKQSGLSKTRMVYSGDLLLTNSMSFGEPYILALDGCIHDGWVCIGNIHNIIKEYLYYFLCSNFCKMQFQLQVAGGVVQNLNVDKIASTCIILPPLAEQTAIASYLDKKCSNIDAIITKNEQIIEKLKEYKSSLITEKVTKGLNPDVEMKDSGIEWLGEIPADWELQKIKHNFKIYSGATPKSDRLEYWGGNITWITPTDYKTEDKYIQSGKKTLTEKGYESCGTRIIPEESIIFSKRAPVGAVAINKIPLCTNQGCLSCIPNNRANVKYFYYAMSVFTEQFNLYSAGTTFKEISTISFANFLLPFPPLTEQTAIANYLDEKCSIIDSNIAKRALINAKLAEYKKSLIYEVVTGKKEII